MLAIAKDGVACLSVCLLVTTISPAKTSEPIEMPFGKAYSCVPKEPRISWVHTGATWRTRFNVQLYQV